MKNSNGFTKSIGSFILGAAVGGALGVLLAPDKGKNTRKKLISKGNDFSDAIKEKYSDLLGYVKTEVEAVKDQMKK